MHQPFLPPSPPSPFLGFLGSFASPSLQRIILASYLSSAPRPSPLTDLTCPRSYTTSPTTIIIPLHPSPSPCSALPLPLLPFAAQLCLSPFYPLPPPLPLALLSSLPSYITDPHLPSLSPFSPRYVVASTSLQVPLVSTSMSHQNFHRPFLDPFLSPSDFTWVLFPSPTCASSATSASSSFFLLSSAFLRPSNSFVSLSSFLFLSSP